MKNKHATKQGWLIALMTIAPVAYLQFHLIPRGLHRLPKIESVVLIGIAVWQAHKLVGGWLSRRHEVQADAVGLTLSKDGAAFISGLAKVHRMNATPLEFERLEEGFSTHPSTQRRFEAVARAANISREELTRLIADGLNESERYPLPAGIAPEAGEEGLLFTSRVKQKSTTSFTIAFYASISVPPAIAASLFQLLSGPTRWAALAIFLPVYAWTIVTTLDRGGHGSL